VVAQGSFFLTDPAGTSWTWWTTSRMSTTVVTAPSYDSLAIYAQAFEMYIPSAYVTATPTFGNSYSYYPTTYDYGPTTTTTNESKTGFRVGNLAFIPSIVVSIFISIIALISCCCFCCCIKDCCRDDDVVVVGPNGNHVSPPVPLHPVAGEYERTPTPPCSHKGNCVRPSTKCCLCLDSRASKLLLEEKIRHWCVSCNWYWRLQPESVQISQLNIICCLDRHASMCTVPGLNCCACIARKDCKKSLPIRLSRLCRRCRNHWTKKENEIQREGLNAFACVHRETSACTAPETLKCCLCQKLQLLQHKCCESCRQWEPSSNQTPTPPNLQATRKAITKGSAIKHQSSDAKNSLSKKYPAKLFVNAKKPSTRYVEAHNARNIIAKQFDRGPVPLNSPLDIFPPSVFLLWRFTDPISTESTIFCPRSTSFSACLSEHPSFRAAIKSFRAKSTTPEPDYSQMFDLGPKYPHAPSPPLQPDSQLCRKPVPSAMGSPSDKSRISVFELKPSFSPTDEAVNDGATRPTDIQNDTHAVKVEFPEEEKKGEIFDLGPTRTPRFSVPADQPKKAVKAHGYDEKGGQNSVPSPINSETESLDASQTERRFKRGRTYGVPKFDPITKTV
jgi:hypothetical protein